ncbi:porin [Azohydromonas australica]|uniref:porin n=1 Tax=Azohydromonas australica TaxID=364039 RepID=UPI000419AADD|nr:porin [Azohydromonas australica]
MKKSLILLSLAGTTAVAHAQSSVSISGTVDLYAQRVNGSLTSRSLLSSGGNSSSKLFFRGTEDLGGGLSAGFWLEAGINADTGLGVATNTNNQPSGATTASGLAFNRRAIVFLKGAFGELQLGRNWSPTYDAFTARFDVFGVGSGIGLNYTASINPNQVRVSNSVAYVTPRVFGLSSTIQHWFGENASGSATSKDGSGSGIKLNYDQGKFGAVAAYARTQFAVGDAIYRDVAAIYDFGPVILSANVNRDQQGTLEQKGALVGVRVPVGLHEFKASYSRFTTNAANSPTGEKYAVGFVYNLSKRTAAYTTLARIRNSDGSALAIAGSTTAPDRSSTGFDVGIRHNF